MLPQDESRIEMQKKNEFFEALSQKHKELDKHQFEYKRVFLTRLRSRSQQIVEKSYKKAIKSLGDERNELRAQIWVANGKAYNDQDESSVELVRCHIKCQEHLINDIKEMKTHIRNLESEISYENKCIYELNRKTVPDTQHQDFVRRMRLKLSMLENRLEVGIRQESGYTATNAALREEILTLLDNREFFSNSLLKLITKLNADKKYILELLNYANNTFEDCITVHEKIENLYKKRAKETDIIKAEMQSEMRKSAMAQATFEFTEAKNKGRVLAPLNAKELARREEFRRSHERKINLYNNVLNRLLKATNAIYVDDMIETFQNQESTYYSYYTLTVEIGFHTTLLMNAVERLYNDIQNMKGNTTRKSVSEVGMISELENTYAAKKQKNEELGVELEKKNQDLQNYFQELVTIFNMTRCNAAPMMKLLGNNKEITIHNVRAFLKILEARICGILRSVYIDERSNKTLSYDKYVIKDLIKTKQTPTPLDDIVQTQQCPECAEGEDFNNADVSSDCVHVQSVEETKKKLHEKVTQPEMQYCLHSLSQCRLPRSHILVTKRNE